MCGDSSYTHVMNLLRTFAVLLGLAALLPGWRGVAAPADLPDEVFYHFMPIAWRDSDSDTYRFGDFGGMEASLDYLQTLGVTAIWMNPIFPSPAYHGYQHGAADELNDWFGDESDLTSFLEAAHAVGIKVFVDFVAYGISHDSIWFQDAYQNPSSPYDDWLAFTDSGNTQYFGATFPTWNGDTVGFIHWDLRNSNPVALVTDWAQLWLDPNTDGDFSDGLDGYRLDHVWETYPNGPGGYGYHIDSFWAPWRDALRSVNPDVVVFAEQADWGTHGEQLFPGMDAAFTKPYEFAARSALQFEWAADLYSQTAATFAKQQAADPPGTFLCVIGDHDIDRLASVIGDGFEKGKAAAAVHMTQPFPPIIYYGDEIGMRGTKNTGYFGDAADIPMREPFKWNAVEGAPMSRYHGLNGPAYDGRVSRDNDGRSVEEQLGVPGSQLEAYRELIAARKDNVALRRGGYTSVFNSNPRVFAFLRDHEEQQVLVVINLSSSAQSADLELTRFELPAGPTTPVDLLTNAVLTPISSSNQSAYPVSLGAYEYVLLEVDLLPPIPLTDGREIPTDFGEETLQATQNNGTGLGDNVNELNQLFVSSPGDSLLLGITGNLGTDGIGLAVLFDTGPGGQSVLDFSGFETPPSGPQWLTGMTLDVGFEPDEMLFVNAFGGAIYVDHFHLLTDGGIGRAFRGSGAVGSGNGTLGGGDNGNGMEVALDNSNTDGVTETDASGASIATTGFEMYLPFADLGLAPDATSLGMAAFILTTDGTVGNQWLPGLGGGFSNLGTAPDMTEIAGSQYLVVDLETDTSTVEGPTGPYLDLLEPDRNPVSTTLRFSFNVPETGAARLSLLDVQGRHVRTIADDWFEAGVHSVEWDWQRDGDRLPAGVYFGRLEWQGLVDVERIVLLR